jgi:inosose dehydratase
VIRIGNAPVSYGAFEVTVGRDPDVPAAGEVLDAVRAAGYDGIDLGPLGYLGLGEELRRRLADRELLLTGGYVEIDVADGDRLAKGLVELGEVCNQFDAVGGNIPRALRPRPTVALISPVDSLDFSRDEDWARVESATELVADACRLRGYEACLHNEVGTLLASEQELRRLLSSTSASLCLDTGHLVAAGGDPLAVLRDAMDRVSHVHLKDAKVTPPTIYVDAMELWRNDVFCPLGAGTGHVAEILELLRSKRYSGWIVVEQDVLPRGADSYRRARDDQVANRQYLRDRHW